MNAPPPFVPSAPPPVRKKSNTALIVTIVLVCLLLPCIALIGAGVWGWKFFQKTIGPIAACGITFEEIRTGISDYARDHGGMLPKAASWEDDVRKYVVRRMQDDEPIRKTLGAPDPGAPWGCETVRGGPSTGIAYNEDVSGKKIKDIEDPYSTVLIFEIPAISTNAHSKYKPQEGIAPKVMGQPRDWLVVHIKGDDQFRTKSRGGGMNWDFGSDDENSSSNSDDNTPDASGKSTPQKAAPPKQPAKAAPSGDGST